mgnify:FL=1
MVNEQTVTVEMLQAVRSPNGGRWGPGERAGFPPDIADDLVKRGVARRVEKPPRDKMVHGESVQKK